MLNRNKLLLPIAIIICLLAVTLFACATPPKVTDIEIGGDYITLYNLGEELDLSGMKIKVKYSDSTTAEYAVQDIRQDITVLGFNNAREENALKITITYQGQSAQFTVRVLSTINSSIKYSVKFDTGEGSAIDDVEVFAYTTVNAPVIDPQRDGWYFVGWYKEDSLTNPWDFNTEKIVEETTLYAKWGKLLTVTFAPPQGLEHLFAPIVKNDVREGETYNNRPPVPVRDGYTARWDYNGEWNDLVDTQTIHAEYTLIQYRVVFYFMNESDNEESVELGGGNMTFTYGENVLENQDAADFLRTMPRPSRRNYHISGWKLKDAAGDESESYDAFITHIQSDVHIMAVYHIDMYTVTFNFGEGEDIEENIVQTDVAYGTSVPQSQRPEPPARQHYEFDGWYADQSLSILWNFNTGKIDAARTLYARWTRIYTLVFHGYDGDGDNGGNTITLKVREGDNVVPPAAKAPEGHTAQWDRDSFENIRQDDLEINPLPPVPNQYTIRFVNFDNTPLLVNGAESQLVSYGQSAIAPDEEPQRERYNFLGWSADFSVVIDNMIIAAEFAPIRYTVEFLSDGGDKPAVVVNSGDKLLASMLEITPRNNFDFDGWFKDVTRLLPWNVEEDTVEGNITLYAKWTQLHIARFQYTSAQDETTTITVERRVREGETIKDAPVMDKLPGKNGSWYINGSLVDLSTYYVFNAIDIVAQYAPAVYTVTFRSDGVDYEVRAQVRYNEIISAPAVNPEREGHNFIGWNIDPALTPIVEDTYFDAMFAPKTFKVRFIDAFNENEPVILLHHGEDPGHPEISYGGIAPAPRQNPSHLGWRFIGWGTAAASGVVDGINSNITGHTDIYAQYSKNQYSVTFFSEHDNHIWAVFSVEHGEVSPVPEGVNPSRTGHIFEGWNYQSAPIVENTYINAVFVMARYVVTIHLNGGSGTPQEVSGLYNTFLPEPPKPVFEGKAFLGWYTDAEFTKRYVFENGQSIERLTASFSIYARWEDYVYGDNDIEYSLDVNGTGYIVVSVPDGKEEREIANYYAKDGGLMLPVTAIGYNAFANLTQLKRVTLPQTLSFIGPAAFINCTALEEIVIPDTVATISQNAFSGCTSLVSVGFGEHSMLVEIGSFAFNNASSLFEIEFPSTLEKIGERAFSGASSLETIVIPESINDIGAYAFAGCVNLKYAKFVETAPPRIATTTFAGHSSFFRVYVANLQQYNSGTGGWVTLREQGKIFPINDEYEQAGITQDWAYQVILTGDSAGKLSILQYIGGQSEVVLENTLEVNGVMREVIEVGAYAFDNTVHTLRLNSDFLLDVNTLTAATELKHLIIDIKDDFFINREYISEAFRTSNKLTELSLSAKGITLEDFFFSGVPPTLRTVNILEGATHLPENMFRNAQNITKVTLPSTLLSIGAAAFKGCVFLEEVDIASTILSEIGTEAFDDCIKLSNITIPSSVSSIGVNSLRNTAYLADIIAEENFDGFVILGDEILYLYQGDSAIIRLPDRIKVINDYAFYRNTKIRTLMFALNSNPEQNALREIRARAFDGAINLEHIVLPTYLNTIGAYAFNGANKLSKAILFSDTVPSLGTNAFSGVMSGFEIYTPLSPSLYPEEWENFNLIESRYLTVLHGSNWIFNYTSALRDEINLIQYFGESNQVVIGANFHDGVSNKPVASIANYAFVRSLEKLTISAAVQTAGSRPFNGLTRLKEFTLLQSDNIVINKTYLYNLLNANAGLSVLNIGGSTPIKSVFGDRTPPSQLTTINILSGETFVAEGMFEDCEYVVDINVPGSVSGNRIGANAFRNSGWEREFPSDFVVLPNQSLLVSYKGADKLVRIPETIDVDGQIYYINIINRKAFNGNDFIEIIYIDNNINLILPEAFGNMTVLNKMFISGNAPAIEEDSTIFTPWHIKREIFVDTDHIAGYGDWENIVENKTLTLGDYIYEVESDTVKLIQFIGLESTVSVPSQIDGKDVTALGNNVFFSTITSLTMFADNATGSHALANLTNLTALTVLDTNNLNAGVAQQLEWVFASNNRLRKLSYLGDIPVKTLLNNSAPPASLREVVILDGAVHLVEDMLDGATTVSSISLPASVKTIGVYAFEGTDWYHMQGNFVEPIPGLLYKYKGTDEEVIIPSSIKVVNEYAFVNRDTIDVSVWRGNRRVTKITFAIGSEATEIRDNAFYDCIYLRDINLPETLRLIAPSALTNTGIRNDSNGMLIAYGDASAVLIKYNGTATSVEIPAVVTVINAEAFKNNTTLTSVTVPENSSLKVIAESAFEGCTALANFNIPSSVVFIGKDAFRGTPWLGMQPEFIVENERLFLYSGTEQDVVIPAGITSIIGGAFASLTAPNSVEITQYIEILDGAFDNVTVIYVPDEDKEFYMDIWEEYASKIAGVSEKP